MKTEFVVAGYIFNPLDKTLLFVHHKKLGLWLPVGGHIEENETPDDALRREAKEETGLDLKLLNYSLIPVRGDTRENLASPFYVNVHSVGDHNHCCFFYLCSAKNSEKIKLNSELTDYQWLSLDKIPGNDSLPEEVQSIGMEAFMLMDKFF